MARLHNTFFRDIWDQGIRERKVSGQISHSTITPPWFGFAVILKHGPCHNLLLPYVNCTLPNKNGVKARGGRNLADTVLSTWLRKEDSTGQHLRTLFQ